MLGNAVRPAGENPCDKTSEQATEPQNLVTEHATDSQMAKKSLVQRLKDKAKGLFGK
jgi:hypothetical protein